jgi:hypothetical protein
VESRVRSVLSLARALKASAPSAFLPPSDGTRPETQQILPHAMVRGSRGYLERVCYQINGCYENGWFDACAVMMRRLLETLIIEVFEHHKIDSKVKNSTGEFFFLRDLIDACVKEASWNLSRNTKQALPKLKLLGDQSAHSRRYNAHREDIDKITHDFRSTCQELLYLAGLK